MRNAWGDDPVKEEGFDEGPWTEEQWERFMEQSDLRAAKFMELWETFMDKPDCEELVARAMGWDFLLSDEESEEDLADFPDATTGTEEALTDEELEEMSRRGEELHAIPAYTQAYDFGLKVHEALKPFLKTKEGEPDWELGVARVNAFTIAVKIAGGHAMGYDDGVLCGNIVCCKRALAAADKCLAALESLKARGVVPAEIVDPLLAEGKEVRCLVEERIAELRSQVWWE